MGERQNPEPALWITALPCQELLGRAERGVEGKRKSRVRALWVEQ